MPVVKNLLSNAGDIRDPASFHPWVGKIPWRRGWQPTPIFLLGEPHRQRSLVCCSPWGRKESDVPERLNWTEDTDDSLRGERYGSRSRKSLLCFASNFPTNALCDLEGVISPSWVSKSHLWSSHSSVCDAATVVEVVRVWSLIWRGRSVCNEQLDIFSFLTFEFWF